MRERLIIRRLVVRAELLIGAAALLASVVCPLAAPRFFGVGDPGLAAYLPLAGIAGVALGYAWMLRIAFADPEAGPSPWRYRGE